MFFCILENEFAWKDDEEFGRQLLAGINPTVIKVLQVCSNFSHADAVI